MRVIRTARTPRQVEADCYIAFGSSTIPTIRYHSPFTRNLFRYCPNAFTAIRRVMKYKNRPLGKAVLTRDRIYHEKEGRRYYDVYIAFIPVKPNSFDVPAKKEHLVSALGEIERILTEKSARIRVVCLDDIMDYAAQEDLFELDLIASKLFARLWDMGLRLIIADGDYAKASVNGSDEYGFISRTAV